MNEQWQELKETIIEMRDNDGTGTQQEVCKFLANYMDVLEKQMTNGWIPVSKRFPKTDEDVLVCNSQGTMEIGYYHIDNTYYPTEYADSNETGWYNENDDVLDFEPIAWMPLPEPYKAESEEDKCIV